MSESVAVITFAQNSETYEGFSKLTARASEIGIVSAALVERDGSGVVTVPQEADTQAGGDTATGSLIGLLVGVIGGPLGMLLGAYTGAVAGLASDASRADSQDGILDRFALLVPSGRNAILAQTLEQSPDALDAAVASLGGVLVRTP